MDDSDENSSKYAHSWLRDGLLHKARDINIFWAPCSFPVIFLEKEKTRYSPQPTRVEGHKTPPKDINKDIYSDTGLLNKVFVS